MITTSAGTPRRSWAPMVLGPLPCEAPLAVVTVIPEIFSNMGPSSSKAAEKPPDVITLTCANDAAGQARSASNASTHRSGTRGMASIVGGTTDPRIRAFLENGLAAPYEPQTGEAERHHREIPWLWRNCLGRDGAGDFLDVGRQAKVI